MSSVKTLSVSFGSMLVMFCVMPGWVLAGGGMPASASVSASTSLPASSAVADNAADLYREAASLANALTVGLYDYEIDASNLPPDKADEHAAWQAELMISTRRIAQLLAAAKAIETCEFGIDFTNPLQWDRLPIEPLEMRRLARITMLRAQIRFQRGEVDDAIDEVIHLLWFSRRCALDATAIAVLGSRAVDLAAIGWFAACAPQMTQAQRKRLLKHLDGLPAQETVREAFDRERQWFVNWARKEVPANPDQTMKALIDKRREYHVLLENVMGDDAKRPPFDPKPYEALLELTKSNPKAYDQKVDEFDETWQQLIKLFDLPPAADVADALAKLKAKQDGSNIFISDLFDDPLGILVNLTRVDYWWRSRDAMLKAGLAYLDDGDAAIEKRREPITGATFKIVKHVGRFEIHSRTVRLDEDRPLSLNFGPAKE